MVRLVRQTRQRNFPSKPKIFELRPEGRTRYVGVLYNVGRGCETHEPSVPNPNVRWLHGASSGSSAATAGRFTGITCGDVPRAATGRTWTCAPGATPTFMRTSRRLTRTAGL